MVVRPGDQDLLSLMTSGPRTSSAGGLRVAGTKVASSKAQRRAKVHRMAIFWGIDEQQVAGSRAYGEQRVLLAGQRGPEQTHHSHWPGAWHPERPHSTVVKGNTLSHGLRESA